MSCPMNPKTFWGFQYKGPHELRHVLIRTDVGGFGFIVTIACPNCGFNYDELHSWRSLVRHGYSADKIKSKYNILKTGVTPAELK
jgi:hypothetical protein